MAENVERLKRGESFLGIHFDFHAGDDNYEIGKNTTEEQLSAIIDKVKPDFIQTDCKGHRGFSSYPTRVGNPAPGIVKDALRLWRKVTAERGVSLYLHYSGVWDDQAILRHPEWAVVNADGRRDPGKTATLGPYADELLIPQLKELIDEYQVDGVWIDGDCWATVPDYSPAALEAFRRETGLTEIPKGPGDPGWFEFREFFREAFRRYVRHYSSELHRYAPDFQIASNWAWSSFMPEPVSADVDYISGDYTLQNSVNSARFEGRTMARQGKPWDLMAWGFSSRLFSGNPDEDDRAFCTKTALQLQQEAAVVVALGGGFQAYFTQRRDGAPRLYQMDAMGEAARFARERQPYCHKAMAIPQVAVVNSGYDYYRRNNALFAPGESFRALRGNLQALLENQYSVEVLSEHHLKGRMAEYGLIVLPETISLAAEFREELLAYVRSGGSLLVVGAPAALLFARELGIGKAPLRQAKVDRYLNLDGRMTGLGKIEQLIPGPGLRGEAVGLMQEDHDAGLPGEPAASVVKLGKGKLGAVYFSYGERYLAGQTALLRDFMGILAGRLFPNPQVQVSGSHLVDVCLNRKDGHISLSLVNTGGPHANPQVYTYDEVPPVGPLEVRLRLESKPREIELQPGSRPLRWDWRRGAARIQVPQVDVHEVVWVEEG